jgi:iron complex outermembrane receptor protein
LLYLAGRRVTPSAKCLTLLGACTVVIVTGRSAQAQNASADTGSSTAVALPAVSVQGSRPGVLQDTQGFVSQRDTTGTKTDTPLNEVPQSISVINRQQLDSRQVQSLGEALRYTAGVQTEAFGADPHVDFFSIRGFSTNDTGVYLNGLRLSPGITALAPEPYGLERIDVLKGPASVLYGQNAPGGLVNLVSKRPTNTPLHEVELLGGSYGRIQGQFDLGGPLGTTGTDGKWSYRLTGLVRDAGSQVDHVPNDRQFIAPSITYRPDADTSVTLLTSYQHDHSAGQQFLPSQGTVFGNPHGKISTSTFTGEDQYNKVDRTQINIGYEFEHRFNDMFTVRQNARFSRIDYSQRQVYGLGLESDMQTLDRFAYGQDVRANVFDVDNQAEAKFATGPVSHTVIGGFEYNHTTNATVNRGTSATSINIFNPVYGAVQPTLPIYTNSYQTQNLYGLYLQDQMKWNRFILTVGGRQDWVDTTTRNRLASTVSGQSDNKFTYRVGLGYEAPLGFTPYVSYARSFLPVVGVSTSGQALKPTEGEQVEVGIKYQPLGYASNVTVAAFDLRQTNVSTTDPTNPLNTVQTGEIRVRGFETEAQVNLFQGLNALASYTYLDPVVSKANDGTQGKEVGGVPRHMASAWLEYTLADTSPVPGLSFGGGVRYTGSTQASNSDLFKVSDHTLVDAAVRYNFGQDLRWRLALNANNLFDRTFVAQCSGASFCYYGARREVLASLGVRW